MEALVVLLLGLLDRAAAIGTLITTARKEGREITDAEIDALVDADDAARADLVLAIEHARAEGR